MLSASILNSPVMLRQLFSADNFQQTTHFQMHKFFLGALRVKNMGGGGGGGGIGGSWLEPPLPLKWNNPFIYKG